MNQIAAASSEAMQLAGARYVGPIPNINYHGLTAHAAPRKFWQGKPGLLVSYMPLANSISLRGHDSQGFDWAAGRKAPAGTRIAAAETKQRNHAVDAAVALQSSLSDSRKAYEPASEQTRRAHVRAEA